MLEGTPHEKAVYLGLLELMLCTYHVFVGGGSFHFCLKTCAILMCSDKLECVMAHILWLRVLI